MKPLLGPLRLFIAQLVCLCPVAALLALMAIGFAAIVPFIALAMLINGSWDVEKLFPTSPSHEDLEVESDA